MTDQEIRHFLEIDDLSAPELASVLALAESPTPPRALEGKGAALIFEKPSTRTRNSMEMAVVQLGGHPVAIQRDEIGLGVRESVEDIARTLGCYHSVIGARVFAHETVEELASAASVPVINMLSDEAHPLQALADLLTIRQELGELAGRTLLYVGDANNVCRSLVLGASMMAMKVRVAAPQGFQFTSADVDRIRAVGGDPLLTASPGEAVGGADVVYTDVWTSMGQEDEAEARHQAFEGFTVDEPLMASAGPGAIFLHCLPAHRGEEVSAGVVDGAQSRVWRQAANRMHAARGLLAWLLGDR